MKVSELTKKALLIRRDRRDRAADGWHFIGEGGGVLWELHRGVRFRERITEVAISACGKALWIKTAEVAPEVTG